MRGTAVKRRAGVLLLAAALLAPAVVRAQCTKDTDCKYDRICVDGECVGPPELDGNAGTSGQAAQKKAACTQKCEHVQSKCLVKIRPDDANARVSRKSCFVDHQRCLSDCGVSW